MTQVTETSACRPNEYLRVFLDRLDNPSDLWKHAFENQIGEASRNLLLVLGSCEGHVFLSDLREAFASFHVARGERYGFPTSPNDFGRTLQELEGNFIRLDRTAQSKPDGQERVAHFHNPSIADFLRRRFCECVGDVMDVLRSAVFFEQVERLFRLLGRTDAGERGTWGLVDPTMVRDAIQGTLTSRSARLIRSGQMADRWTRRSVSVWDRLETCCRIGTELPDSALRSMIQQSVDHHFEKVSKRPCELPDIMALLTTIEGCEWFDSDHRGLCHTRLKDALLAREDEFEETMDGLSAAARWFVEKESLFRNDERKEFKTNLVAAVTREVEDRICDGPSETLDGDLAAVEEISKTLGWDFSGEIRRLNDAIAESGSPGGDDNFGRRDYRTQGCSTSIESLFDALLE
jgi:hypothetical protein